MVFNVVDEKKTYIIAYLILRVGLSFSNHRCTTPGPSANDTHCHHPKSLWSSVFKSQIVIGS